MQATSRTSRFVARIGTMVGIAAIALAIGLGGSGNHGAAAWSNAHAMTAGAGCAAGTTDPPGTTTGTVAPRYGGGGGALASRQ